MDSILFGTNITKRKKPFALGAESKQIYKWYICNNAIYSAYKVWAVGELGVLYIFYKLMTNILTLALQQSQDAALSLKPVSGVLLIGRSPDLFM
jgi:hypothetical protein